MGRGEREGAGEPLLSKTAARQRASALARSERAGEVLGVDIGGVIIDRVANDAADTSFFGDSYLRTTAVLGALEALRRLADERFGERIYLVSKVTREHIEARTREWLAHQDFYDRTRLAPERVRFCRQRADKAPVCRELGVTHFVDDRAEVVHHLADSVAHRYLFGPQPADDPWVTRLRGVTRVGSWNDVLRRLLG